MADSNFATLPTLDDGSVRYARGWFIIGKNTDFTVGETKSLNYFDQSLVAYRRTDGKLVVMDAFCPHTGTHLGKGGTIEGNNIRCPKHGWCFNSSGQCVDIPYCKTIPSEARIKTWKVMEINQLVFLWYDPIGGEPDFDIPKLPEAYDEQWSSWYLSCHTIETNPREVIENVADKAHFVYVHQFNEVLSFHNKFEDHMATQEMVGRSDEGVTESKATYYGPAYQITWMKSRRESETYETRLLNASTPIGPKLMHLFFGVMVNLPPEAKQDPNINEQLEEYVGTVQEGFNQDIAIWEHKLFRSAPVFCDGDGPVAQLRRWYAQFYKDKTIAERV